jgi:hypothetical protein
MLFRLLAFDKTAHRLNCLVNACKDTRVFRLGV